VAHNTTIPIASVSGQTSFAAMVVDNTIGDLFTASSSGLSRFVIKQSGYVGIGTATPTSIVEISSALTGTNLFNVISSGSNAFTVSDTSIVNNLPASFTAPGDISIAYDINFTNTTSSNIKSAASMYLQAGKPFNSDNLTLGTYNLGNVIVDSQALSMTGSASISGTLGVGITPTSIFQVYGASTVQVASVSASTGKVALLVDNTIGDLFTASSSGMTRFVITQNGNVGLGTTNPTTKLDVNGTAYAYTGFRSNNVEVGYYASRGSSNSIGVYGGNLYLQDGSAGFTGSVGIGTTSPLATFDIRGNSGITPVASVSGQTSFAAMVVDNKGTGDIFTASSSGLNRFVLKQNGYLGLGTSIPTAFAQISTSLTGLNIFDVVSAGSSAFTVSDTGITNALPTSFTAAGDVAIAYDINFTNPTASYLKSAAPLYLQAGEQFNSSDLTLRSFNKGNIIVDAEALNVLYAATVSGTLNVGTQSAGLATWKFYASDYKGATASAVIENTSGNAITGSCTAAGGFRCHTGLIIKMGTTLSNTDATSVDRFITFMRGDGVVRGIIAGNGSGTMSIAAGPDFAETFIADPLFTGADDELKETSFPEGTAVCQGPNGAKPCEASESAKIIGVISNRSGFIGAAHGIEDRTHQVVVGLLGQVPIRIASDSAAIKAGDPLTIANSGLAQKATGAQIILGKALTDWNGTSGTVEAYVNEGFTVPPDMSSAIAKIPEVAGQIAQINSEMEQIKSRLAKAETDIGNIALQQSGNMDVATLSASFATFSDSLHVLGKTQLSDTSIGGTLNVGLLHFDDITAEISSLNGQITLTSDLKVLGSATVSEQLAVDKGIVLKDKTTGEDYCLQIDNGEITKTKGACL
jgi:hypothetical protein